MGDQLKNMIDKLKKQEEAPKAEAPKPPEQPLPPPPMDQPPAPPPPPTPIALPPQAPIPQAPQQPIQQPEAKNELTQEQKDTILQRIGELQNTGLYRFEALVGLEELTTSIKDLTLVISSLIKQ